MYDNTCTWDRLMEVPEILLAATASTPSVHFDDYPIDELTGEITAPRRLSGASTLLFPALTSNSYLYGQMDESFGS